MIGKVPPKTRNARSSFSSLVNYVARDGEIDPDTGEVTANAELVYLQNINYPEIAATEMWAVAQMNSGVRDPVMHVIISWREDERPTQTQAAQAVEMAINKLGFRGHQAIAYSHTDTSNYHTHIVINRIHPDTYKSHYPDWAYKNLDHCMREIELKQGWRHDRGHYVVTPGRTIQKAKYDREIRRADQRAKAFEHRTGCESFQTWISKEPRKAVEQVLKNGNVTWNDLHRCLDKYNLEIRESINPAGRVTGYVIVDKSEPERYHAKASQLSRQISKGNLDKTIGRAYEAPALILRGSKQSNYGKLIERVTPPTHQPHQQRQAPRRTERPIMPLNLGAGRVRQTPQQPARSGPPSEVKKCPECGEHHKPSERCRGIEIER